MLLLHLPNPAEACRRFVELTAPAGQIMIHDADFTSLALADASTTEAAGLAALSDPRRQLTGPTRWVVRARRSAHRPATAASSRSVGFDQPGVAIKFGVRQASCMI